MAEQIVGMAALQGRLKRVAAADKQGVPIRRVTAAAIAALRHNIPRKTSNTSRTIVPVGITSRSAQIWGSKVVRWLDEGTGLYGPHHHKITPLAAKALAFHSQAAGAERFGIKYRLSGSMTSASMRKYGPGADFVVVRSVKGMPARPFINKSVTEAAAKAGVEVQIGIVNAWNGA